MIRNIRMYAFDTEREFEVVVVGRTPVSADVVGLDLELPDGGLLPAWRPGSHVDVHAGDQHVRQYSLCSDPAERHRWQIAVLYEPGGRGGSAWLHDQVDTGTRLRIRGPRNHFSLEPARRYVFLAGGVGITPIRSMIAEAERSGAGWVLHYAGRSRANMAFAEELVAAHGDRVLVYPADEGQRLELESVLAEPVLGTLIYGCGPARLIEAAERACAAWPAGSMRAERFVPREVGAPVLQTSFEVDLLLTGKTLTVPPDRSILDVAEEHGVFVLSSCREGTCGTCETPVLEGVVDHRDSVLTDAEQQDMDVMMICVSRAACPKLVLEL